VDVLFRSAVPLFGPAALGVDLGQDQASSVVWGMPGAIVRSGLPHTIVPLAEVAEAITNRLRLGILGAHD
jgi:two-component system, chemotaxis family, protein-glutamate methylesterase/glutaminase